MGSKKSIRATLESKKREELIVLARKMGIRSFGRLRKEQLIDRLLDSDATRLGRLLSVTWWSRRHNHVYGAASVLGVTLTVLFFALQTDDGTELVRRPILRLHADVVDGALRIRVSNSGDAPGRLLRKSFGLWRAKERHGDAPQVYETNLTVYPDDDITCYTFRLDDPKTEGKLRSRLPLGFGSLILYESVDQASACQWTGVMWLELIGEPRRYAIAIVDAQEYRVASGEKANPLLVQYLPEGWKMVSSAEEGEDSAELGGLVPESSSLPADFKSK